MHLFEEVIEDFEDEDNNPDRVVSFQIDLDQQQSPKSIPSTTKNFKL